MKHLTLLVLLSTLAVAACVPPATGVPPGIDVAPGTGAAPDQGESALRAFVDSVMQLIVDDKLVAAYTAMAQHSTLPVATFEAGARTTTHQRDPDFRARFGRSLGYAEVGYYAAGPMRRLVYVERTEKLPLVWEFVFYQSPKGWVLTGYNWGADAALVFDGVAPARRPQGIRSAPTSAAPDSSGVRIWSRSYAGSAQVR